VRIEDELRRTAESLGGARIVIDQEVGTVSAVGDGVQSEPGIAARMFGSLAREKINIDLISTSNLMITCVIPRARLDDAVRAVHREFLEEPAR
jgi:aspartate kinase